MDDMQILALYFKRDEAAIAETARKYGSFCHQIALNILSLDADAEECVNDTWLQAWNAIPPQRPDCFSAWLGRVVRNIAINLWNRNHSKKRYSGMNLLLNELEECIPSPRTVEWEMEEKELTHSVNTWLDSLSQDDRILFIRRYWNGETVNGLAEECGMTPELSPEAEVAFADIDGVMKIYKTLNNEWFLADDLTDFSQVLMTDIFYIVPDFIHGIDGPRKDGTYGVYTLDENGEARWGLGVSVPDNGIVPYELGRLTYDIIEEDLAGIDYEDYIITQSNRLYTVFIWARCADGNDVFVTYPARPEFVGLENRGRYTLEEIQNILSQKYSGS